MCEQMHASTLSPGFCKIVRSMIEAADLKLKCRFLVMVTVFISPVMVMFEAVIMMAFVVTIDVLTFDDFCDICRKEPATTEEDLLRSFRKIDVNGDGFISNSELRKMLTTVFLLTCLRICVAFTLCFGVAFSTVNTVNIVSSYA